MENKSDLRDRDSPGRVAFSRRHLNFLLVSSVFFSACNRKNAPSAMQLVSQQLKSPDAAVRLAAVDTLRVGVVVPPEFLTPLIELLQDPDASVRTMSALALRGVEQDCGQLLPHLTRAFEAEKDARVKTAMFEALDALTKRHQDDIEGRIRRTAERE